MIGTAIALGAQAIGSVAGALGQANARKKLRQRIQEQQRANRNWYNTNKYADPTKRADVINQLTKMSDTLKQRNRNQKGRQAVMGGTEEGMSAVRSANNNVIKNVTGNIYAANEARKDQVEQQYQNTRQTLNNQLAGMDTQRAAQLGNAVSQVSNTAAKIAAMTTAKDKPTLDNYEDRFQEGALQNAAANAKLPTGTGIKRAPISTSPDTQGLVNYDNMDPQLVKSMITQEPRI